MSASSRHIRTSFGRGVDLVGQVLAAGRRLGSLQQQARRERALALQAIEMDGLDAGQLGDRRHGAIIGMTRALPHARSPVAGPAGPAPELIAGRDRRGARVRSNPPRAAT